MYDNIICSFLHQYLAVFVCISSCSYFKSPFVLQGWNWRLIKHYVDCKIDQLLLGHYFANLEPQISLSIFFYIVRKSLMSNLHSYLCKLYYDNHDIKICYVIHNYMWIHTCTSGYCKCNAAGRKEGHFAAEMFSRKRWKQAAKNKESSKNFQQFFICNTWLNWSISMLWQN